MVVIVVGVVVIICFLVFVFGFVFYQGVCFCGFVEWVVCFGVVYGIVSIVLICRLVVDLILLELVVRSFGWCLFVFSLFVVILFSVFFVFIV